MPQLTVEMLSAINARSRTRRKPQAKRKATGRVSGRPQPGRASRGSGAIAGPSEHEIQRAFFDFARPYLRSKGIDPRLIYSVPNSQVLMASARGWRAWRST